jgi:hypothetical protein
MMKAKNVIFLLATACALATSVVQAATHELWAAGELPVGGGHGIARYSAADGSFLGYFMHTNSGAGVVVSPGDGKITKFAANNSKIYVAYLSAANYNKVARYDRNGANAILDHIAGPGANWRFGSYYYPIKGLAFGADHIFVLAGVYSTTPYFPELDRGTYLFRHLGNGAIAGTQPNTPSGYSRGAQFNAQAVTNFAGINGGVDLTRDSAGNFYAFVTTPAVFRFAPDGQYFGPNGLGDTNAWIASSALPAFKYVSGNIVIDSAGRLYLGGTTGSGAVGESVLLRYNSDGTPAGTNGTDAVFAKYINYLKGVVHPLAMTINPVDGHLYVANGYVSAPRYENMINRFYIGGANDGKIVEEGGFANRGGANAPLYKASGLVFVSVSSGGTVISVQ